MWITPQSHKICPPLQEYNKTNTIEMILDMLHLSGCDN